MVDLSRIETFDWDDGNAHKSVEKHGVSPSESEQVFFNNPLVLQDMKHSGKEPRYHALGVTDDERFLHVTFTLRVDGTAIRVISSRPMNRKERARYEKET